jgi:hypothetical protein
VTLQMGRTEPFAGILSLSTSVAHLKTVFVYY